MTSPCPRNEVVKKIKMAKARHVIVRKIFIDENDNYRILFYNTKQTIELEIEQYKRKDR